MKQFFKMVFASAFGVLIAFALMTFLGFIIIVGMLVNLGSDSKAVYTPRADESVYKLSLGGVVYEEATDDPLSMILGEDNALSLKDIIASIQNAKEQGAIKGIYLNMGLLTTGTANVDVIRRALLDFKESGKFIVAYADNYTQAGYYLASVADEVYLNPLGTLALTGFASQTMFYKGILEKAGIEMMVFKVGKYKGAVEPFIADKLSDENREQITAYQSGIWNSILNGISKSRKIPVSDISHFADAGLFFADPAKAAECGLIDSLKYRSEVDEIVKEKAGQTGKTLTTIGLSKMKRAKKFVRDYRNKLAVIYAEGEIVTEPTRYSTDNSITEKLSKELIKLKDDEQVKAVVLRVNSPGGSAYVSDQIWKQVVELKKVKPVVVSMGNVAASGGYYISCAADKIVAEANTLTGSIGIFGIFPNMSGLFEKLALTTDIVKTNEYADLGDISRPMTPDEMALIQSYVERGYDIFLTRCAEGRNKTKEEIDAIGQGRVWTGAQALELGLVDELGGIDRAIELAAEKANIVNYTVINVSTSKDFFKELLEKQLEDVKTSMLKNWMGEEYEYYKTLRQVKSTYGIQARIPYDLRPL
jgi:protease-4